MSLEPKLYVGEWIAIRNRKQDEFAKAIGMTDTHLSRIVNNRLKQPPRRLTLQKIASELKCPGGVEDLFYAPQERLQRYPAAEDCIDLDTLADDPKLRIKGKPLTEEQKAVLRFIIKGS
jgi:transcriptional regulator with XRE-family HTH domain